MYIAIAQPWPSVPMTRSAGTHALSRKISEKWFSPSSARIGRTSIPGWSRSTNTIVNPLCPGPPERASSTERCDRWPNVLHTFWPLSRKPSPSGSIFVRSDARSLPASGSLNACAHLSSPRSRPGSSASERCGANTNSTGTRISSVVNGSGIGMSRFQRVWNIAARNRGSPPSPPALSGQPSRDQPESNSSACRPVRCAALSSRLCGR